MRHSIEIIHLKVLIVVIAYTMREVLFGNLWLKTNVSTLVKVSCGQKPFVVQYLCGLEEPYLLERLHSCRSLDLLMTI